MKINVIVWLILVFLLIVSSAVFGRSGVEIDFTPIKLLDDRNQLPLELTISNFSGVPIRQVEVYYRYSGQNRFQIKRMENQGFNYVADLNVKNSESNLVEYYFAVHYMDEGSEPYPAGAPNKNLFRTSLQQMRDYGDDIVVISPEPGEQIFSTDIVITASFTRFASLVDVEKTKIYIDTWDVSKYIQAYGDFISFAPRKVPTGRHKIRMELYDKDAALIASREWFFSAIQARIPEVEGGPLNLSGRVFAEGRQENLRDGDFVTDYNQASLQLNGSHKNLSFGGRVYLNNQESSDRQPVNRFSGFAKLNFWNNRYVSARFGDAHPRFNPLILQNIILRGIHGKLFLKSFNLDVAYGQTNRGVEGRKLDSVNPVTGEQNIISGTFERDIFAVRPSFGARDKFQFGLTYLKGSDDTTSIQFGREPKENAAVGADLFVGLDNQRIVFEGNINASAYNRNITGGSIEFDTLQNIVEDISDSEEDFYNLAKEIITVNQNLILRPGLAYQARVRFRYFKNNLSLMYESVDEEYFSLGQPYILRDNRGFHIVDNISVFKNQVFLTLGYRRYENNLQDTKNNTTTNSNLYANLSYFPMGNLPQITVGYNNYVRENDVSVPDTTIDKFVNGTLSPEEMAEFNLNRPEDNQTNSLNFSTGYRFNVLQFSNHISLNLTNYRRSDIFDFAESSSDFLSINLRTEYRIPLRTRLEFILQQTETGVGTNRESNLEVTTFGLGANYTFRDVFATDRLVLSARARLGQLTSLYKLALSPGASPAPNEYNRNYFSFRINYALPQIGNISLMADILNYTGDRDYNDFIYTARYDYNF